MAEYSADECVARAVIDGLRGHGADVIEARVACSGDDDERVLSLAASAGRIVITEDWGFGELTVRHREPAAGNMILSLFALSSGPHEAHAVAEIVRIGDHALDHLVIIEPSRVRTRPLLER